MTATKPQPQPTDNPSLNPHPLSAMGRHALALAARGYRVFPLYGCLPDGTCSCGAPVCPDVAKHPRVRGGFNAATTDARLIAMVLNA